MPGFFGGVGGAREHVDGLRRRFLEAWPDVQVVQAGEAVVGGHAYSGEAVGEADGSVMARDGEFRLMTADWLWGSPGIHGAGVVARASRGELEAMSDPTGVFPLYYAPVPDGILVSTLLRPLAEAIGAAPDPVGIAEFLRFASTFDNRTLFSGIRRLGPGQVLTWSPDRKVRLREGSRLWTSLRSDLPSPDTAAEEIEPMLREAVGAGAPEAGAYVLMMSAGWDSRSLLAAATATSTGQRLEAFSHGDLGSRELRIAERLSAAAGVPWRARPIGADVWDPENLSLGFARTETLVFPHWTWAGRVNEGAASISSGVLGEVLGGHYGATHVARGGGKVAALLKSLTGDKSERVPDGRSPREQAEAALVLDKLDSPWYLAAGVEADRRAELLAEINQDIVNDIARLESRGVGTASQLVEAFVTEHRGAQYIAGQARALRVATDTSVPYAHAPLLELAAALPQSLKIHNRVNRALGLRSGPALTRPPMAATLVPGTWPLLLQEASRAVRKVYEESSWALYSRTKGRTPRARLGWVDFEFLRDGAVLTEAAGSLRADLWNRGAFDRLAEDARSFAYGRRLHPVFDQMGKILTVDRFFG
jgi:hypothetical protein